MKKSISLLLISILLILPLTCGQAFAHSASTNDKTSTKTELINPHHFNQHQISCCNNNHKHLSKSAILDPQIKKNLKEAFSKYILFHDLLQEIPKQRLFHKKNKHPCLKNSSNFQLESVIKRE